MFARGEVCGQRDEDRRREQHRMLRPETALRPAAGERNRSWILTRWVVFTCGKHVPTRPRLGFEVLNAV